MSNLTKLAKGEACLIRVPGYCSFNPETTVGCHVRLAGVSGAGMKSPDCCIAFGCFECHQVVDGQRKSEFSYEERRLMLLEGMVRTQARMVELGKLKW